MAKKKIYKHHERTTIAQAVTDAVAREMVIGSAERQAAIKFADGASLKLTPWFDARAFGATGDGSTNDTAALQALSAAVQAAGGGTIRIPPGDYRIFGGTSGEVNIFDFTNITKGIRILMEGVKFTSTRSFADGVVSTLFKFTACHNLEIGDFEFDTTATLQTWGGEGVGGTRGVELCGFHSNGTNLGCRNVRIGSIKARGARAAVFITRDPTTDINQKSRNFVIENLDTENCGRAISCQYSGDNVTVNNITANKSYRTCYVYNVRGFKAKIRSKNHGSADLLLAGFNATGYDVGIDCGLQDIGIEYLNMDSGTDGDPNTGVDVNPITIAWLTNPGGGLPVKHRNIRIKTNIRYPEDIQFESALMFEKYIHDAGSGGYVFDDGTTVALAGRGHVLDGFYLTGMVEGRGDADTKACFDQRGEFSASGEPDIVRNFNVDGFSIVDAGNAYFLLLNVLQGTAFIRNFYSTAEVAAIGNPSDSRVVYIGCKAASFTHNTADTSYHDYYSCHATDVSLQSLINKVWYGKCSVGGVIQPNAQEMVGVSTSNASNAQLYITQGSSTTVGTDDLAKDVRLRAGTGGTVRNAEAAVSVRNDAALFCAVQHILGIANNSASHHAALALLVDASLSFRYQAGSIASSTLLSTELANLSTNGMAWAVRNKEKKGANVTAANDLTLGLDGNKFTVTGNTQINGIATANWVAGSEITLLFTGTPTVKNNTAASAGFASLLLSGSADLVAANNVCLTLWYDGTNWQEKCRKVP